MILPLATTPVASRFACGGENAPWSLGSPPKAPETTAHLFLLIVFAMAVAFAALITGVSSYASRQSFDLCNAFQSPALRSSAYRYGEAPEVVVVSVPREECAKW